MSDKVSQGNDEDIQAVNEKVQMFLLLKEHGPRNEEELQRLEFKYYHVFLLYLLSTLHCAALILVLLLMGYVVEPANNFGSSAIHEIVVFIFLLILYYSIYGSPFVQGYILFPQKHLISSYRRDTFLRAYQLYVVLGLMIGVAAAALVNNQPWAQISDQGNIQLIMITFVGVMNLVTSFVSSVRVYLEEPRNLSIVRDWLNQFAGWKMA